jgi:hypothetical protein
MDEFRKVNAAASVSSVYRWHGVAGELVCCAAHAKLKLCQNKLFTPSHLSISLSLSLSLYYLLPLSWFSFQFFAMLIFFREKNLL